MQENMPLLSVKEVAGLLSCSVSFVWRLARRGEFPQPMRKGTRWTRWRKADVLAWLENPASAQGSQGESRA